MQASLGEPRIQPLQLHAHNRAELLLRQRIEHHDVVESVHELGLERLPHRRQHTLVRVVLRHERVDQKLRTQVRGQNQDRVAEVDRATLPIGQAAVVEHLQQQVEHLRVRLLDLVEQNHRVRAASNSLGQLTALLVADIPGRGTDEPRHRVLLAILRHVDAHDRLLVVEQQLGERLGELGLAHAGGAEEQKRPRRLVRVGNARTRPAHRIRHRFDRASLTDQALAELGLECEQLLGLALHQPPDRNPGPGRHDTCDVIGRHLVADHAVVATGFSLGLLQQLLDARYVAVEHARRLLEVAVALSSVGADAVFVELLTQRTDLVEGCALALPALVQLAEAGVLFAEALVKCCQPLDRCLVLLACECEALELEPVDAAAQLIDLERGRVDLHAQAARGLVDQVDRLVGQLPGRNVPVRQRRGCDERRVSDRHLVVRLVALFESAQNGHGVFDRRLADIDLLEASLHRSVFLDELAVLVERRRTDEPQLTAREHRLEHVRSALAALCCAGAHDHVQLVNEGDDLALGVFDLGQHVLDALFEVAAELAARNHRVDVELHDALALEALGHIAGDHALREALDHCGLADAGLTDQHRVVLGATREHLADAPDLAVATDDRVEPARSCNLSQVGAELLERRLLLFFLMPLLRHSSHACHMQSPLLLGGGAVPTAIHS